jgi:hypothetical protein
MQKQLTEEELEFCELLFNPKCFVESLCLKGNKVFWNDECETIKLRPYQIPFLQYDVVLEDDDRLSEVENFRNRINAGTLLLVSSRNIGKSFCAIPANILHKLICYTNCEATGFSYDEKHTNDIFNPVKSYFEGHPFFKMFCKRASASSEKIVELKNGNKFYGVNETIKGKSPGASFQGKHSHFIFGDEIQMETEAAKTWRIDAIDEKGAIELLSGITLISKTSPLGKQLRNKENINSIVRLPQYVRNTWDSRTRQEKIRQYSGENSTAYLINVSAEFVENASGAFDMELVRNNYDSKHTIKKFEITKKNFDSYKNILLGLEKHRSSERTFVFADIGDTAATEIFVAFKVNGKYQVPYNITTFKLTNKQQVEIIKYIFDKVEGDFVAPDATVYGKPVYEGLCDELNIVIENEFGEKITKERVIWVAFNESIVTGFEKEINEETGEKIIKCDGNGKPVEKKESCIVFAVKRLRELFYDNKFLIPDDFDKFDEQFSNYVEILSGNKLIYDTMLGDKSDHIVAAFEVFAIMEWKTEQMPNIKPENDVEMPSIGVFNS